jgi:hypothetical protein
MEEQKQDNLQDLILDNCSLGCNGKCSELWINEIMGHRIVCKCTKCNHDKKDRALGVVAGSASLNAHTTCNDHLSQE